MRSQRFFQLTSLAAAAAIALSSIPTMSLADGETGLIGPMFRTASTSIVGPMFRAASTSIVGPMFRTARDKGAVIAPMFDSAGRDGATSVVLPMFRPRNKGGIVGPDMVPRKTGIVGPAMTPRKTGIVGPAMTPRKAGLVGPAMAPSARTTGIVGATERRLERRPATRAGLYEGAVLGHGAYK